jgi:hypothetical protein
MMELRFVERTVALTIKGDNVAERRHILQFRRFPLGTDASGALTPAGSPGWTEWQDVPIVVEP